MPDLSVTLWVAAPKVASGVKLVLSNPPGVPASHHAPSAPAAASPVGPPPVVDPPRVVGIGAASIGRPGAARTVRVPEKITVMCNEFLKCPGGPDRPMKR